jgi:hypothetical protein
MHAGMMQWLHKNEALTELRVLDDLSQITVPCFQTLNFHTLRDPRGTSQNRPVKARGVHSLCLQEDPVVADLQI